MGSRLGFLFIIVSLCIGCPVAERRVAQSCVAQNRVAGRRGGSAGGDLLDRLVRNRFGGFGERRQLGDGQPGDGRPGDDQRSKPNRGKIGRATSALDGRLAQQIEPRERIGVARVGC